MKVCRTFQPHQAASSHRVICQRQEHDFSEEMMQCSIQQRGSFTEMMENRMARLPELSSHHFLQRLAPRLKASKTGPPGYSLKATSSPSADIEAVAERPKTVVGLLSCMPSVTKWPITLCHIISNLHILATAANLRLFLDMPKTSVLYRIWQNGCHAM